MELLNNVHYKTIYKMYFLLRNVNHNNILIHGSKDNSKTSMVLSLFQFIYPQKVQEKQNNDFNVSLNNNYFYFNCKTIKNKVNFLNYFKEIIKTYNHFNGTLKYIILDQFECVNIPLQNSLKVILEKSSYTSKIIIITNYYNGIIVPIKSRCINIQLKKNKYDKYIFFKNIFHKKKIIYNDYLLFKDINKCTSDDYLFNTYEVDKYQDILEDSYNQLKLCLTEKLNREKIEVIKKLVSKLQELDINILDLIKRYIIENNNITKKMIDECAKIDFYIKKSYRSLIQYEGIIISLNLYLTNTI
jgi:DNA polymerase III delta prime subunit